VTMHQAPTAIPLRAAAAARAALPAAKGSGADEKLAGAL